MTHGFGYMSNQSMAKRLIAGSPLYLTGESPGTAPPSCVELILLRVL